MTEAKSNYFLSRWKYYIEIHCSACNGNDGGMVQVVTYYSRREAEEMIVTNSFFGLSEEQTHLCVDFKQFWSYLLIIYSLTAQ